MKNTMKIIMALTMMCLIFAIGCESIPIAKIGFCYDEYCGDITFKQSESEQTESIVVEKEDSKTGAKETLYTFTGDELQKIFSYLPGMSAIKKEKPDKNDAVKTYNRLKSLLK